jgi:hypothetical protein
MATKGTWYYMVEGQQQGPITMDQLYGMASQGVVKGDTKVWCEGWSHWVTYSEYTQSKELQNTAQIAAKKAKGGKGLKIGLIIGGSLALVGGVVLMIVMLARGSGGGHDSPEAVIEELVDALNDQSISRIKAIFPSRADFESALDCPSETMDELYKGIGREIRKVDREVDGLPPDLKVELKGVEIRSEETIGEGDQLAEACVATGDIKVAKVKVRWIFTVDGEDDKDTERMELWNLPGKGWYLVDP